jgi:hypothetical protein
MNHVRNPIRAEASRRSARPEVPVEEKVAFLRDPAAYPEAPCKVVVKETHMSWVFLTPERVFKLKKPVRYTFLDFSTVGAGRPTAGRSYASTVALPATHISA